MTVEFKALSTSKVASSKETRTNSSPGDGEPIWYALVLGSSLIDLRMIRFAPADTRSTPLSATHKNVPEKTKKKLVKSINYSE